MAGILACHEIAKTDFVRAEGPFVYDASGRRYVDMESGIWCAALGHGHPRVNQAIAEQLGKVAHLGTRYPNAVAEEAARAALGITGLAGGKCVFLSSGSEAVEFGVQAARRATGRKLMLAFADSYLAAYGSAGGKPPESWLLVDARKTEGLAAFVDGLPYEEIAGFAFEPGGSGSCFARFPPRSLAEELARRVQASGGLVLANEVTTGMGRTGAWFGFQHYAIEPDVVALGKGLGNGYPVSAVSMRREVAESLESSGFVYAQSHQNDPLGCAAAREVIAVMREESCVEAGAAQGEYFLDGLRRLAERRGLAKEARGRGMLLGLELRERPDFSAKAAYAALLEKGFLVGYYPAGNMLRFDPPLTIAREQIDELLSALDETLAAAGD